MFGRMAELRNKNPWLVVVAMMLMQGTGAAALVPFAFSVFIKAIAQDYGWGRANVAAGISLFSLTFALGIPCIGVLIDRWGPRRPSLVSAVLFVISLASMAFVTSKVAFLALFAIVGLFAGATTAMPFFKVVAARFDERRGLALGVGAAGAGLGGIVLPPFSTYLLAHWGWRGGFVGLAVLVALIGLPALAFGLAPPPSDKAVQSPERRAQNSGARPWYTGSLLIIAAALAMSAIGVGGGMIHGVALLTDRGISPLTAAAIMSTVAISSTSGRVIGGFFMDMFFAPMVTAVIFLFVAFGNALLLLGHSELTAWVGMAFIGIVAGTESAVVSYLVSRYCSLNDFGKASGFMLLIYSLATGGAAYFYGYCHDHYGSYRNSLAVALVLAVAAAALIARVGPYHNSDGKLVTRRVSR
jgi:predicted MFS family arabinose efflux permease